MDAEARRRLRWLRWAKVEQLDIQNVSRVLVAAVAAEGPDAEVARDGDNRRAPLGIAAVGTALPDVIAEPRTESDLEELIVGQWLRDTPAQMPCAGARWKTSPWTFHSSHSRRQGLSRSSAGLASRYPAVPSLMASGRTRSVGTLERIRKSAVLPTTSRLTPPAP